VAAEKIVTELTTNLRAILHDEQNVSADNAFTKDQFWLMNIMRKE
jgi:hypothetical protein